GAPRTTHAAPCTLHLAPFCVALLLFAATTLLAQPLDRLTGTVVSDRGEPVQGADVRIEALFGFAGGDFLGQRTFAARTNDKGAWAVIAFKSGIWIFEASAPGRLPDAVALPFHLVLPAGQSIASVETTWHP